MLQRFTQHAMHFAHYTTELDRETVETVKVICNTGWLG